MLALLTILVMLLVAYCFWREGLLTACTTCVNVMIAGLIIQGTGPQRVVVRARGPSLAPLGVTGALANPSLTLRELLAMHVDSTPTLIVNGKYRVVRDSVTGNDQLIELVKYLVARESGS